MILLIKFGICKILNKSINPKNSTIIVNNLAEKNLHASENNSIRLVALELNTNFLFVIYANTTARIIAIVFDIFSFNLKIVVRI